MWRINYFQYELVPFILRLNFILKNKVLQSVMALEMRSDLGIAIAGCYSMWGFSVLDPSVFFHGIIILIKFLISLKSSYQGHSVSSGILTYTDPGISTVL